MDRTTPVFDTALFDTAPPDEKLPLVRRLKQRAVGWVSAAIMPVVKHAARPYLGGETIDEALYVARRLQGEGTAVTFGYWDCAAQSLQTVASVQAEALRKVTATGAYVSLKPPALRFDAGVAAALSGIAAAGGIGLHCDSHGVEVAELSNLFAEMLAECLAPARIGITLPGRWGRSLADAEWALAKGFNIRVVKGQWPDPADPKRNIADGFLSVIDRLAGRARRVAVATHDFELGRAALLRLRDAGTPCELEVLLGMPAKSLRAWASENSIHTRVYVPYGPGFVPNAVGVLKRNPRLVLAVAKDRAAAVAGLFAKKAR